MIASLALSGLTEWQTLTKVQRRFVWRQFIHPLLTRGPMMVAKMCLLLLVLFTSSLLGAFDTTTGTLIVMFFVTFVVTDVVDLLLLRQNRRQVVDFIHNHRTEIQTQA